MPVTRSRTSYDIGLEDSNNTAGFLFDDDEDNAGEGRATPTGQVSTADAFPTAFSTSFRQQGYSNRVSLAFFRLLWGCCGHWLRDGKWCFDRSSHSAPAQIQFHLAGKWAFRTCEKSTPWGAQMPVNVWCLLGVPSSCGFESHTSPTPFLPTLDRTNLSVPEPPSCFPFLRASFLPSFAPSLSTKHPASCRVR